MESFYLHFSCWFSHHHSYQASPTALFLWAFTE